MARQSPKVRLRKRKRWGESGPTEYTAVWYDNQKKGERTITLGTSADLPEAVAEDRCAEIELDLEEGRDPKSTGRAILLPKFTEKHLEWMDGRYHENTINVRREAFANFLRWLGEQHPNVTNPKQVRQTHVEAYQSWRKKQPARRKVAATKDTPARYEPRDRTVSARTVNIEVGALYSLFEWGRHKDRRYCSDNPVRGVKHLREPQAETVIVSRQDDAKLEAALATNRRHGFEYALAYRVFVETGLRPSELLKGMRKADVDWNTSMLRVVHNEFYTPKTGQERAVPVSPATLARLRGLAARHEGARLFTCTVKGFQQAMWSARKATGVRAFPYALRHTGATRYLEVSNLKLVQVLLGHKQIETTARYPKILPDDLSGAAARVFERDAMARAKSHQGNTEKIKPRKGA